MSSLSAIDIEVETEQAKKVRKVLFFEDMRTPLKLVDQSEAARLAMTVFSCLDAVHQKQVIDYINRNK